MLIRSTGDIVKRKKKLSKRLYGTSHIISKDEAKFIRDKACRTLILGTGQEDQVRLSPEAAKYLDKKGCRVIAKPTPEALHRRSRSTATTASWCAPSTSWSLPRRRMKHRGSRRARAARAAPAPQIRAK